MLQIKNYSLEYIKGKKVIDGLNLSVREGDIYAFVGRNGVGKTTTIKSIVGINHITEGDIELDKISILKDPIKYKSMIAYVPDNPILYEHLTGIQYLNFIADMFDLTYKERENKIKEYAKKFELYNDLNDLVSSYSHGMRQKLVLIGAFMHDPKLYVLDEPFVGLDPKASFTLKEMKDYKDGSRIPIKYNHQIAIPAVEKASTVTYYDGQLFVGFFNMYGRGKVAAYSIARSGKNKGSITNNEVKSVTGTLQWSDPTGETSMDKQIQGIAIYQDKIFLSQSYGSGNSKLYVFPTSALNALDEKNAELVVDMPPYLEQITAYKGQLLCVFESASSIYARPDITVMDRILSMNINALFGS